MTTNQALQDAAERWTRHVNTMNAMLSPYWSDKTFSVDFGAWSHDMHLLATHAANLITSQPPTTDERARHAEAVEEAIKAVRQLYDYALHLCYEHSVPFYAPVGPQEVQQMLEPAAAFLRGNLSSTTKEQAL